MKQWWRDRLTNLFDDLAGPLVVIVIVVGLVVLAGPQLAQELRSFF